MPNWSRTPLSAPSQAIMYRARMNLVSPVLTSVTRDVTPSASWETSFSSWE